MRYTTPADRVLRSRLPRLAKQIAFLLALHGNDEGDSIHPSIARLAAQSGRHERNVRRVVALLRELGVLVRGTADNAEIRAATSAENWRAGGRLPVCYRIDLDALDPARLAAALDRMERMRHKGKLIDLMERLRAADATPAAGARRKRR